jgi:hypothetical protein
MIRIAVSALLIFFCLSLYSQAEVKEDVFAVKKGRNVPVELNWVGIENCKIRQLYYLCVSGAKYDSISILNMTWRLDKDMNNKPFYYLSKAEPGKGYMILYTRNQTSGKYIQTYVKPFYFK